MQHPDTPACLALHNYELCCGFLLSFYPFLAATLQLVSSRISDAGVDEEIVIIISCLLLVSLTFMNMNIGAMINRANHVLDRVSRILS